MRVPIPACWRGKRLNDRHAAPGQAVGYLYQCERALLDLVDGALRGRNVTLFLERLDDFHLEEEGRPVDILQVKHHTAPGASLSDNSDDLWRTLDVWMDVLPRLEPDDNPEFGLLTTSVAVPGSAASLLRRRDRDPSVALRLLLRTAADAAAKHTAAARSRFANLGELDQRRIIDAMVVHDGEVDILDLDGELRSRLLGVHPEHIAAYVESFKGWWYARCVGMLRRAESGVTTSDLNDKLAELRDTYHPQNLPFDYDLGDATESERLSYATRLFIRQLEWIAAEDELLALAIDEYHRSYANKSRWLRLGLVRVDELDNYERKLVAEWQRARAFMLRELGASSDAEALERAGRALWRQVSDSQAVRIRPRFDDQNLTRGSYHELADRADQADRPHVGWHPMFAERLRELLQDVA